jgi:serine/threonine-protein kinase
LADLVEQLQATFGKTYTIEREFGAGGMSRLFVAWDTLLRRRVAIKVLPPTLAAAVSMERFNREIMLAAALQHPHIVPVLSAGELDGLPYYIMPFVEGESLRARVGRGPLSVREAVSIMKDVSRALSYAHGRGVIHRDIKPDNILLSGGSATVTDFGVAKAIVASRLRQTTEQATGTITGVGISIGTPAYMAPEQVSADPALDHRADIYALGIVSYEMLAGAPPFRARTPQQILTAHLTEKPANITTRRYDVPQALANIVMDCLQKEPTARPRTANDLLQRLEHPSISSGAFDPPSVIRGRRRWRERLTLPAIIAASLAIVFWTFLRSDQSVTTPAATAAAAPATQPTATTTPPLSLAVLPLVNLGADRADSIVARGLTSSLIDALSRGQGIRVASLTASTAASLQPAPPVVMGQRLNVTHLLEGTVQRQGQRVRVTVRLLRAVNDSLLWSQTFDRSGRDALAMQDDLTGAITSALAPRISRAPSAASPLSAPTDSTRPGPGG